MLEAAMEEDKAAIVQSSIDSINEIAAISDYRSTVKKQYCNLARRLKLLIPMFEEIRDNKEASPEETLKALISFKVALESAKQLLRFGSDGSKIYMVCEYYSIRFNGLCIFSFPFLIPYLVYCSSMRFHYKWFGFWIY